MAETRTIIGRTRALLDDLTIALQVHIGGPPPSKKAMATLRRHNSSALWPTDRGNAFEVQIIGPEGKPTGHIARVTVELERFDPENAEG